MKKVNQIRVLPQHLINQIAAGEVVERPASVIKELVENAIDAGATAVEISITDAGKSCISVKDNGDGMDKDTLEMCVLSHATSKLTEDNLFDIHTFGFRGEALPSIASISRISISTNNGEEAWRLSLEGGKVLELSPINCAKGTHIDVRDLFFATPARLKFLKSDSTEAEACLNTVNRLALAFPHVAFTYIDSGKQKAFYPRTTEQDQRIFDVLGSQFRENLFEITEAKEDLSLKGWIGVPTFNKASANQQYFFVNNRYVKDKLLFSAIKSAYAGLVPQGRYAAAVLYLDIPHTSVDVNAHPAKTEIRFRDAEKVRFFVMAALKSALNSYGAIKPTSEPIQSVCTPQITSSSYAPSLSAPKKNFQQDYSFFQPKIPLNKIETAAPKSPTISCPVSTEPVIADNAAIEAPQVDLGTAIHQIDNTYIISVTDDKVFIIDQHAAAERITLENLKNESLDSQNLLLPEICTLKANEVELLEANNDLLLKFGIHIEKLAYDLVNVTAMPVLLSNCDVKQVISDIVEEIATFGDAYSLQDKIHHMLSTIACHSSLRAGKKLSCEEMNSLLRQMERSPNIAQCCHGRPSYIELSISHLHKFFDRS